MGYFCVFLGREYSAVNLLLALEHPFLKGKALLALVRGTVCWFWSYEGSVNPFLNYTECNYFTPPPPTSHMASIAGNGHVKTLAARS